MDLSFEQRMERTFAHAPVLPLDRNTRYILFSDCHRGVGDNNDNFLRNEFLYVAALETYFRKGYTYIGYCKVAYEKREPKKTAPLEP